MIFFLLVLILVIFNGLEYSPANKFNEGYMDKRSTTAINGIFVVLVVFSHYAQYAEFAGPYDEPYLILREHLNQMVVATFLFYSGYGMMEAVRRKGLAYVNSLPAKFWKLLLRFDCAVILFLILDKILGIEFPLKHILLAFTSWTAVGNSNWYITAILILYICMFAAFGLCMRIANGRAGRIAGIAGMFVLTAACMLIQIRLGRPAYCFNTMLLLPLGCLFSEFRDVIEKMVTRSDLTYLIALLATLCIYILAFFRRWSHGLVAYSIWAAAFTLMIVLITMKAHIFNNALHWFGSHVFSIYILQRIPMMILDEFGYIESHKYMGLIIAIAATLPLALIFERGTDYLIQKLENFRKAK